MKISAYLLLAVIATMFAAGHAFAVCDCKQPAYKDQIDFVTRYMACLEDCFNAQMQQIRLDIRTTDQRLSDLETEIDRLNLKIKNLEGEGTSGKEKK